MHLKPAAPAPLFALPVELRRCRRNPRRLVIVSATGEVLLRTLSASLRDQDVAERIVRAVNEWAAVEAARLAPWRFGLSAIALEEESAPGGLPAFQGEDR